MGPAPFAWNLIFGRFVRCLAKRKFFATIWPVRASLEDMYRALRQSEDYVEQPFAADTLKFLDELATKRDV